MKWPIRSAFLGIPDDHAVSASGGRLGAREGPKEFRQYFGKFSGALPKGATVSDLGDTEGNKAAEAIAAARLKFDVLVVVGGSHDHGFSHLAGVAAKAKRLGCINVDAHLDVRPALPVVTSGSPFWLALEKGVLEPSRFVEFGIQDHCNSESLWAYVRAKKVRVIPWTALRRSQVGKVFLSELRRLATKCDQIALSFDLDAIAAAFAPGVSAPQSEGLTSADAIEICEIAGRNPKVTSLGLFELNPVFDQDSRTARLAATMAWHFLAAKMGTTK